jgi:hypothetical protein
MQGSMRGLYRFIHLSYKEFSHNFSQLAS